MKLTRQILCYAFTSLVLFSSSYLMVGIHFCSGTVQHVALFSKAEGCAMEKMSPLCHRHESRACCEDKSIVHEGQSYNSSIVKIDVPTATFVDVVHPPVLVSEIIPAVDFSTSTHADYDPPLPASDLTVSLHTFLI